MRWHFLFCLTLLSVFSFKTPGYSQHSIAREWNEVLLEGIRNDYAWPVVHARNLFHVSAAMFDAFAVFDENCHPYFLGKTINGFNIPFDGFTFDEAHKKALQEEAISFAVYRLMYHRYFSSPDFVDTRLLMDGLMQSRGYDISNQNTDYSTGSAAALGNYIAEKIIEYGIQDGANELGNYESVYYAPINEPLQLAVGGDNPLHDPNRWQPLMFGESFIDQSGNVIEPGVVDFLGPEWGNVTPFALTDRDKTTYHSDGETYHVYVDPGAPPKIDNMAADPMKDEYKWGFALVASWSGHLDPFDGKKVDISPGAIGNYDINNLPDLFSDYSDFYDFMEGLDPSHGRAINPYSNLPYESNVVNRGDYARVLAEFWADGPDSETPPGHWFTILNYVNDHPLLEKKFRGEGPILDDLEWDVKAYFLLGGTMHDAAVAAWSAKGYYDYIRPISALRYMATLGQSTDSALPGYHPNGLPLIDGKIELISANDPLVGGNQEHLNEIKLWAWKGHDIINDPDIDQAGVGWILAKDWWPYQRPSFVTPPFAGYVSGHSTYSRAAAEVITQLTGTPYFPGGMGIFYAPKNEFLVFEEGPSEDVTLQWATYYDAADQCSLSRIWGGIHPPQDDLNGRKMGAYIGGKAFEYGKKYFTQNLLSVRSELIVTISPNPAVDEIKINWPHPTEKIQYTLVDISGRVFETGKLSASDHQSFRFLFHVDPGFYHLILSDGVNRVSQKLHIKSR